MKLSLLAPDKSLFDGDVKRVLIAAAEGPVDIYPDHADFVSYLLPGFITFETLDGKTEDYFSPGGYAEVRSNVIHILADRLIKKSELSVEYLNGLITKLSEESATVSSDDVDKIEILSQKIAALTNISAYSV